MIANKNGQTLILFVILLPLMITLIAFLVDIGLIVSENSRIEEVTKNIIKEVMESKDTELVREIYEENDIAINNLEVKMDDNVLNIKNNVEIYSVFGKILGINKYKIKIDMTGEFINGKLFIESGD